MPMLLQLWENWFPVSWADLEVARTLNAEEKNSHSARAVE